jgi:hypothetical protein
LGNNSKNNIGSNSLKNLDQVVASLSKSSDKGEKKESKLSKKSINNNNKISENI